MKQTALILAFCALPALGHAACVPPEKPVSETYPALFDALALSPDETAARDDEDTIWREWVIAPDEISQNLLNEAMRRIRQSDFTRAEELLDELIAYCPDYSEGWNQRAYARFLQGAFDGALTDIQETLKREPRHFAALSGKVRILFSQGRIQLARRALAEALEINPWLREKRMLKLEPLYENSRT